MLRELREDDADAVADLFHVAFGDAWPIDAAEIVSWVRNQELKPEWLRVLEEDGLVVGYGDIWIQGDELALDVAAPGHWLTFIEWAEQRAREEGMRRVRLFFPVDHELAGIAQRRGYRHGRSSFTMHVRLGDRPPQSPGLPEGFELRGYRAGDEEPIRRTLNQAFASDPSHHEITPAMFREFHLQRRGFEPALWRLAWHEGEFAGMALAYAEAAGEPDLGWISVLAVGPPWRRRGLGEALLRSALCALHARGVRRVGLGVDTQNETGALRLYERIGMHAVRQGDSWMLEVTGS
jgi:ribosomal protein S18 acetylase RimI-like enzyme